MAPAPPPSRDQVERLAATLDAADTARGADIAALDDLSDDEVDALAAAGDLPDPDTDGIEGRCI